MSKVFRTRYPFVFGGGRYGKNRPRSPKSREIEQAYHWSYVIDILSGGEFLKWEDVLNRETGDCMTYLDFHMARNAAEAIQYEYEEKIENSKRK